MKYMRNFRVKLAMQNKLPSLDYIREIRTSLIIILRLDLHIQNMLQFQFIQFMRSRSMYFNRKYGYPKYTNFIALDFFLTVGPPLSFILLIAAITE